MHRPKMRVFCIGALILVGVVACTDGQSTTPSDSSSTGEATAAAKSLTGEEIREAFVGNTMYISGFNGSSKWEWAAIVREDKTQTARNWWADGGVITKGAWVIEGDALCSTWEKADWNGNYDGQACYTYTLDPNGGYTATGVSPEGVKGRVFNNIKVKTGNPYNL